jgi:ferredoxin
MLGLDIASVPIFDSGRARGMGEWRLGAVSILGDYASPPALKGFDVPKEISVGPRMGKVLGGMVDMLKRRPVVDLKLCRNCGSCVASCPVQAIDPATKAIDYSKCIECLCCHEMCMFKAVELRRTNKLMALIAP